MRFQGKPGSLQPSCREKGRRFRDTRLLGSTTTASNLVEESPIVQIQDKSIKERFQERIQAGTVREMQETEGLLPVSTPNIPATVPHAPGAFTSAHPQLHSLPKHFPPTVQKQGPALQREKKMQEQLREKEKGRNRREGTSKGRRAKIRDKNLG